MNKKAVVCAVMALCMTASSGISFAQGDPGGGEGRARGDQSQRRAQQMDRRDMQYPNRQMDRRGDNGRHLGQYDNRGQMNQDARRGERGAGPDHQYYQGGRLPPEYRGRQYVVEDWRGHRLSPPPRGYHWVQTGGDYVLVAIATGIILQLLLNN